MQGNVGLAAFGHPEERVKQQFGFGRVGLGAARDGILLTVGRRQEGMFVEPDPAVWLIPCREVQHGLGLGQFDLG